MAQDDMDDEAELHEFDDPHMIGEGMQGSDTMTQQLTPEEEAFEQYIHLFKELEGQNTPMPEGILDVFLGMGAGGWALLAAGIALIWLGVRTLDRGDMRNAMLYLGACGVPLWIGGIAGAMHILPILSRYDAIKLEGTWRDLNITGLAMGLTPLAVGLGMTVLFSIAACGIILRAAPRPHAHSIHRFRNARGNRVGGINPHTSGAGIQGASGRSSPGSGR